MLDDTYVQLRFAQRLASTVVVFLIMPGISKKRRHSMNLAKDAVIRDAFGNFKCKREVIDLASEGAMESEGV